MSKNETYFSTAMNPDKAPVVPIDDQKHEEDGVPLTYEDLRDILKSIPPLPARPAS